MAIIRQIAQLGHPVLRKKALPVVDPYSPAVQALVDDMIVTVQEVNGVGIAAPQVYESLRILIIASKPNPRYPDAPDMTPTAVINPELLWSSEEEENGWEGCLSIPGIRGFVPRSRKIGVRYLTPDGKTREEELGNFIARIFQHELDHLDGVVFLDRLRSSKHIVTEKEYLRIMTSS